MWNVTLMLGTGCIIHIRYHANLKDHGNETRSSILILILHTVFTINSQFTGAIHHIGQISISQNISRNPFPRSMKTNFSPSQEICKTIDMSTKRRPYYWSGGPWKPYMSIEEAHTWVQYAAMSSTIHVLYLANLPPVFFKTIYWALPLLTKRG